MATCYDIFRYWEDKYITKCGEITDSYERGSIKVVENEHLPSCWACGRPVNRRDILSWDKYDVDVEKLWRDKKVNSKLERCHIIARQFGGQGTPDNLFLLCPDCHFESPDTENKAAFFRWIHRRKRECAHGINIKRFKEEFTQEIESRGYDLNHFAKQFMSLPREERDKIMDDAFRRCGTHGTRVADSTIIACLVDGAEKRIIEDQEQAILERKRELVAANV